MNQHHQSENAHQKAGAPIDRPHGLFVDFCVEKADQRGQDQPRDQNDLDACMANGVMALTELQDKL